MAETASPLSLILGFVPGAVGGFNNVLVGHPVDLVKVQQQTANNNVTKSSTAPLKPSLVPSGGKFTLLPEAPVGRASTVGMLRNIARTEGLVGLYAGVTAPLLAVVPAFGLTFWTYDFAARLQLQYASSSLLSSDLFTHPPPPPSVLTMPQVCIAGGCSGVALALVVGPLERIKCLMQIHRTRYTGFVDCVQHVYREGGMRSVFKGTAMTLARDIPGNAAYFGAYQFTKRTLEPQSPALSIAATLLAGGLGGVASWIVAIPFDVVKSRWQTAAPGEYRNPYHVLTSLLEKEGPKALFRGLSPALIRAFPANAACILGVETTQKLIDSWMMKE